ncbi:MAG: hypothetical protein A2Y34_10245, partial [Spirochaetes bacterium GWC1_27_15]
MKKLLVVFITVLFAFALFADEQGDQIAQKNFNLKDSKDSYSEVTMILIDKDGNKKSRKLTMFGKETSKGRNSYVEFSEPADVKGTKFLTIGNKIGDDEQRLYLPALKKTRLISSSSKNGKFVGSDLYYYDMEDKDISEFTFKFLKDDTFNNKNCFVLEMTPKDKNAPYSKTIAWIAKDDFFAYKLEAYDKKDGELLKVLVMVEVKVIDGVMIPTKTVVENKKDGTKTLLQ